MSSMMQDRAPWTAGTSAATITNIKCMLDASELTEYPLGLYTTIDPDGEKNVPMLASSRSCTRLLMLDPRGGYFDQSDMAKAVHALLDEIGVCDR